MPATTARMLPSSREATKRIQKPPKRNARAPGATPSRSFWTYVFLHSGQTMWPPKLASSSGRVGRPHSAQNLYGGCSVASIWIPSAYCNSLVHLFGSCIHRGGAETRRKRGLAPSPRGGRSRARTADLLGVNQTL